MLTTSSRTSIPYVYFLGCSGRWSRIRVRDTVYGVCIRISSSKPPPRAQLLHITGHCTCTMTTAGYPREKTDHRSVPIASKLRQPVA
ncbi:hypothetical protein U1Q18_051327 [Sarracenia purpurea var. burkii]